jgi:hypothetical protein
MNKLSILIIWLIIIPISSCKQSDITTDTCKYQDATKDLPWLKDRIASFVKTSGMLGCPGRHILTVKSALNNGQSAFIVNFGLCGQAPTNTEVYSCDGTTLCKDASSCQTMANSLTNVKQIYSFEQ